MEEGFSASSIITYNSLSDDYANTLKELRGILNNGDLTDAFDLIDGRLNSLG